ncbi:MAG: PilZ domain-containing protein [Hyphomicrobiales bacterium]|nr:PilZ domain-containing protein [Alphaproteobacteria bacterium]
MQAGEKRKTPRRSMSYPAFLDVGADKPPVKCTLCDASQEGAQLAVANPAELPNEFILALSSNGAARRRCRVVWRTEAQIGVEFLKDNKNHPRPPRHPMMGFETEGEGTTIVPAQAPEEAPGDAAADQFDIDALSKR